MAALTLWAHDGWATLIVPLLHDTVLADRLDERADVQVAHQHLVVTGAVQAGFARLDLFALRIVLVLVITSC